MGLTLLIAEDEPDLREIIRLEFEGAGWKVIEADNGKSALAAFRSKHIDAVITDVRMPGGGGIELLSKIKSLNKKIPVLILTGFTDVHEDEALIKGALGIVKKPFDLVNVFKTIEAAVSRK